jgi:catechol 2,3-dioxygenase-like lactoylglutathione lyase family enzyme
MQETNKDPFSDSELTTILVVSDLERSASFYSHILGAEKFREYGGNSIVYKFLNNWILLVTPGGPTEDKPETHFLPPANEKEVSQSFTIRVKDCLKSYDILKKRGAHFLSAPAKRGKEIRCFFRDPDGHLFEISEYRES